MLFPKLTRRVAFNHLADGNYAKAERSFRRLRDAYPDRLGSHHNLALAKLAGGKYAEATALLTHEIDRFGVTYHRVRALADAYYLWGKREEARLRYEAARSEEVGDADRALVRERCRICGDESAFLRAQSSLRAVEAGNVALAAGDIEDARHRFEAAVRDDPTNIMAHNNLGSLLMNHDGAYAAAAERFEAALQYADLPVLRNNVRICRTEAARNAPP